MGLFRWCQRVAAGTAVVSVFLPWVAASDPFITLSFSGVRVALGDSPIFVLNPYAPYAPVVFLSPAAAALIAWRSFRPMTSRWAAVDLPIMLLAVAGLLPVPWLIAAMLDEVARLVIFGQVMALGVGAYLCAGAFGSILALEMIPPLMRLLPLRAAPAPRARP